MAFLLLLFSLVSTRPLPAHRETVQSPCHFCPAGRASGCTEGSGMPSLLLLPGQRASVGTQGGHMASLLLLAGCRASASTWGMGDTLHPCCFSLATGRASAGTPELGALLLPYCCSPVAGGSLPVHRGWGHIASYHFSLVASRTSARAPGQGPHSSQVLARMIQRKQSMFFLNKIR